MNKEVAAALGRYMDAVEEGVRKHRLEIDELRREIAELREAQTRYVGAWQKSSEYRRGTLVTHDGCLWHCCAASTTTDRPGSSDAWQLTHKTI